jgi:hypothetical protein
MRRLAVFLMPVLALAACTAPGYGPYPSGGEYSSRADDRWYDSEDLALAARIVDRGAGNFAIDLNRPAYVAVFEILPGQGVGLMYPSFETQDAFYPAGFSILPSTRVRNYDWFEAGYRGQLSTNMPRFYFLVASKRPLRISRFQRSDGALRSVLGLSGYTSLSYQSVMGDLVNTIVPYQPSTDWTTDVFAVWPDQGYNYYYTSYPRNYTRFQCVNGTYEILPWELARFACGGYRGGTVNNGGDGRVPPPRRDTTQVTAPGKHRPEPPATGDGGGPGAVRRTPQTRREPREIDLPRITGEGDGGGSSDSNDGPRVRPSGEPRVEAPKMEPRSEPRAEPRSEPRFAPRSEPRGESPRTSPRTESPRMESPRSEPRSEPRSAPAHNDPPARSDPGPSRASAPPPSPPPPSAPPSAPASAPSRSAPAERTP